MSNRQPKICHLANQSIAQKFKERTDMKKFLNPKKSQQKAIAGLSANKINSYFILKFGNGSNANEFHEEKNKNNKYDRKLIITSSQKSRVREKMSIVWGDEDQI